MKRIRAFVAAILLLAICIGLCACVGDVVCTHEDADTDGKCDECSEVVGECSHKDNNANGECDKCGAAVYVPCTHEDKDTNGKCDKCSEVVGECSHKDENTDGECDKCGEAVGECTHADGNGDRKCDKCGEEFCEEHDCYDENGDGRCDKCDDPYVPPEEIIDYPWDNDTLLFQLTDNDNNKELSSGCRRYLAGDLTGIDLSAMGASDDRIKKRNDAATAATGISIEYTYWPNNHQNYCCGNVTDRIEDILRSTSAKDAPDVYVNFLYDMMVASVNGYFANLKSTGANGNNYFEFNCEDYDAATDDRGYLNSWMDSLSLVPGKSYLLASDYFIDVVRAAQVIPVGVNILEQVGPEVNGTLDFTLDDFYNQVWNMEWTYAKLMEYSAAAHADDGVEATTMEWIGDERVGFACSISSKAASGLLYSTGISLFREFPTDRGGIEYMYPQTNDALLDWADAIGTLFSSEGVIRVKNPENDPTYDYTKWGNSSLSAIRKRFSQGAVLFGDIVTVGSLEDVAYQSMRDIGGFGVTVLPLYKYEEGDRYLTPLNNVARVGAIAYKTPQFEQCTAYLNYQSTHSAEILNDYFHDELTCDVMSNAADQGASTVKMLQFVRDNIRTSFDMAAEDAAAEVSSYDKAYGYTKFTYIMYIKDLYINRDILRMEYDANYYLKQNALDNLMERAKSDSVWIEPVL